MNKPQYIFPRIGIINLKQITNLQTFILHLQSYHGKYFTLFNLTNTSYNHKVNVLRFKWRGVPFSITEAIKIIRQMEDYLRTNKGNTVVFVVNQLDSYTFVRVLLSAYLRICQCSINNISKELSNKISEVCQSLCCQHMTFLQSLFQTYKSQKILQPPIKTVATLSISCPNFIPIFQILTQTRYNQFQSIYSHQIQSHLTQYYFNLNKPLESFGSVGNKYYDRKPETKYLAGIVLVAGDVTITCSSFNHLESKKQFIVGFNTNALIFSQQLGDNQGIVTLDYYDTYQRSTDKIPLNSLINQQTKIDKSLKIYIKLQNWCDLPQCAYQSNCQECIQQSKKLHLKYSETQIELNKLVRKRKSQQVYDIFSLNK